MICKQRLQINEKVFERPIFISNFLISTFGNVLRTKLFIVWSVNWNTYQSTSFPASSLQETLDLASVWQSSQTNSKTKYRDRIVQPSSCSAGKQLNKCQWIQSNQRLCSYRVSQPQIEIHLNLFRFLYQVKTLESSENWDPCCLSALSRSWICKYLAMFGFLTQPIATLSAIWGVSHLLRKISRTERSLISQAH